MDYLNGNYLENTALYWMKLILTIHCIGTTFLMCWSAIHDSMETYLLITKSPHVIYVLYTTYTIAVLTNSRQVKYLSSGTWVLIIWVVFFIFSVVLITLDILVFSLVFMPTVYNCYYKNNLPLSYVCDQGDERLIYTITGAVSASHALWTLILLVLSWFIYQEYTKFIQISKRKKREKMYNENSQKGVNSYGGLYSDINQTEVISPYPR